MGLAQYQAVLARIYTDEEFQQSLSNNNSQDLHSLDLTDNEKQNILALLTMGQRLGEFASSLVAKRRNEVGKQLPVTKDILTRRKLWRDEFKNFAAKNNFSGPRKHQLDAIAFARYSANLEEIKKLKWLPQMINYEADCIEAWINPRKLVVKIYTYPVHILNHERIHHSNAETLRPKSRLTVCTWVRATLNLELKQYRIITIPLLM
jgi:hypothetical protein